MGMRRRNENGRMDRGRSSGKQKIVFVLALAPACAAAYLIRREMLLTPYARFAEMAFFVSLVLIGGVLEFLAGKITKNWR